MSCEHKKVWYITDHVDCTIGEDNGPATIFKHKKDYSGHEAMKWCVDCGALYMRNANQSEWQWVLTKENN